MNQGSRHSRNKIFRAADNIWVLSRYAGDYSINWIPAPRLRGGKLCAGMTIFWTGND